MAQVEYELTPLGRAPTWQPSTTTVCDTTRTGANGIDAAQTNAAGSLIARGSRLEKPAAVVSSEGVTRRVEKCNCRASSTSAFGGAERRQIALKENSRALMRTDTVHHQKTSARISILRRGGEAGALVGSSNAV